MVQRESTFRRASNFLTSHWVLVIFGALASIGGVLSITSLATNLGVSAILVADGFSVVGKTFLPHAIAIILGVVLALVIILLLSGFGQGIMLGVVSAGVHEEDDVWYGALRKGLTGSVPLMQIWLLFYIVAGLCLFGVYHLATVLGSSRSETLDIFVSIAIIAIVGFLLFSFAIVAMNASCFVSIYRMKTSKAIACGFDLFIQTQFRSLGMMILLAIVWIITFAIVLLVAGAILFVAVWLAHFIVSPAHLAGFLGYGLVSNGLLITLLLGILFVTNAVLTTFSNTVWTIFFLDHVSSLQLPKKKILHDALHAVLPEVETV